MSIYLLFFSKTKIAVIFEIKNNSGEIFQNIHNFLS